MNESKQRKVSFKEIADAQKRGDASFLSKLQVSGTVRVLDKNGNVKSELPITSLELNEDFNHAT